MILLNPAQRHMHLLEEFEGQSFPEQPQASIMDARRMVAEYAARKDFD